MKGMGNMLKQAQKLQSRMAELQNELADRTVESSTGGGMVRVVVNGRQQVLSVELEKEIVNPEDLEMLQDLVLAAVNDALVKSNAMASEEMKNITGGFDLPGLV